MVAAKAMNLPADVLQRMLLFMNPKVGQSVDRVYELAELYSEISVDAARRLIAIWRAAERVDRSQAGTRRRLADGGGKCAAGIVGGLASARNSDDGGPTAEDGNDAERAIEAIGPNWHRQSSTATASSIVR